MNMKRAAFAAWAAASLACGAAPEVELVGEQDSLGADELGQLKQSIYVPSEYGIEGGGSGGARCIPPWSGGMCMVPDKKAHYYTFDTASCYPWTVQRINEAIVDLQNFWGNEWPIQPVAANLANVSIKCDRTETLAQNPRLGRTAFWEVECHDSTHGDLCQFGSSITIYDGKMINEMASFKCTGSSCETRRRNFARNVFKHEFGGHAMGLAHDGNDGQGQHLMDASFHPSDVTKPVWLGGLNYHTVEQNGIDCYNQTSGTNDDCND